VEPSVAARPDVRADGLRSLFRHSDLDPPQNLGIHFNRRENRNSLLLLKQTPPTEQTTLCSVSERPTLDSVDATRAQGRRVVRVCRVRFLLVRLPRTTFRLLLVLRRSRTRRLARASRGVGRLLL